MYWVLNFDNVALSEEFGELHDKVTGFYLKFVKKIGSCSSSLNLCLIYTNFQLCCDQSLFLSSLGRPMPCIDPYYTSVILA